MTDSHIRNRFCGGRGCQIGGSWREDFGFLCGFDGRKCATKCATKHGFLGLLSVLYSSFIVFINQSHSGGFCPSSGLIKCEAKPQQALFADFLEGGKQTTYLCRPFQQRLKIRGTLNGGIAQLARALAWHARGPGFESPYLHQQPATGIGFWLRSTMDSAWVSGTQNLGSIPSGATSHQP